MNKESTFARFHEALDYLINKKIIIKQLELADILGMSQGSLSSALKNRDRRFTEGFVKRFAAAYSDYINGDWLLTGEGQMEKPDKSQKPHIEAKVAAGYIAGILDAEYGEDMRDTIPGLPEYDFTIEAVGDSMMPRIEDSDILACRKITDKFSHVKGRICIVASKDGAAVKVITAVNSNSIVCHSLNPAYRDYEVAFSDLIGIALVVGSIRRF